MSQVSFSNPDIFLPYFGNFLLFSDLTSNLKMSVMASDKVVPGWVRGGEPPAGLRQGMLG